MDCKVKQKKRTLKKRIIFFILILFMVVLLFAAYIAKTHIGISLKHPYDKHLKNYSTDLSQEEMYRQDLEFIYQEIKNNYVNLEYKEKVLDINWDQQYEYYKSQIDQNTSRKDFYRICNEFISDLKDGHTWFSEYNMTPEERVWTPYSDGIVSAFDIRMIDGTPIIVANKLNPELNGYEVVSINHISLMDILETMIGCVYRRGNDESAKAFLLRSNDFYEYFELYSENYPEQFLIELKDSDGVSKTITLDSNVTFQNEAYSNNNINFGLQTNELPVSYIEDNIGYIRIDTFDNRPKSILDTFNEAIENFKKTGVDGVVLDLRNNGGGNESFRDILGYLTKKTINIERFHYRRSERYKDIFYLRFIWDLISSSPLSAEVDEGYSKWRSWRIKPAKEQYLTSVPVVVICNESIFSSTNSFVLACLENNLATVVGNTVPLSGFGLSTQVLLPSGNYVISYCFFESQTHDGKPLENIEMKPDITISQTYEDFRIGIDTQLEAAFQVIREKRE
ncbi:hypothetical protein H0486_08580 [Lachnospiraceae bacterium MD1]|uniref:Tail specific protease domain-containing protein n=1 Tax=Variimorphobacter saccharofermentans TaxID=2755051 RepID=A0A839K2L7_9FIRM|nr:S41 family peptidase [Variimorphobacter saccharofermentans]MBB2182931.1 hypothetical protein [Variimorphobacter saccharofermentans]